MIHISADERRRAFSVWLRTGRAPSVRDADGVELKFNPWHDPSNGRFTFAGTGQHDGSPRSNGAAAGPGARPARSSRPTSQNPGSRDTRARATRAASPGDRAAPVRQPPVKGTWRGGGFTGGGGGDFGGGGASATGPWGLSGPKPSPASPSASATVIAPPERSVTTPAAPAHTANPPSEQFHTIVRNGYTYQIDSRERTRRVSGALTTTDTPVRSRTAQSRAGGAERRATDDGGHYIAVRFKGPTEAFNHFAQDATVNRGRYRLMEDQWARAKRAGKQVTVKIVPLFDGKSLRPSTIDVSWTVDGLKRSVKIPNERPEVRRGK